MKQSYQSFKTELQANGEWAETGLHIEWCGDAFVLYVYDTQRWELRYASKSVRKLYQLVSKESSHAGL